MYLRWRKFDNSVIRDLTIFMVGSIFENSNLDDWNVRKFDDCWNILKSQTLTIGIVKKIRNRNV